MNRSTSKVADIATSLRSLRRAPEASSVSASARSLSRLRSWTSSNRTAETPASSGSAWMRDRNTPWEFRDRKSTRLNSSHSSISYAVFCLKKKKNYNYAYEAALRSATAIRGRHTTWSPGSREAAPKWQGREPVGADAGAGGVRHAAQPDRC